MSVNVPLCLQLVCTDAVPIESGNSNAWYAATFQIPDGNYQYYNLPDQSQAYYSTMNIKKGYWIAGYQGGHAWRVIDIDTLNATESQITLTLEDVDNYNMQIDSITNNGAINAYSNYICFQVNNEGLPVFAPLFAKYIDTILPQLPSDILSRFLYRNPTKQYVQVSQSEHTFSVGDPVWLNPDSGLYELANTGTTAKYIVGIVSSIGVPTSMYFTYKSFGAYYSDIQGFFSSTIDSIGTYTEFSLKTLFPSITPGTFVYIDTDPNTTASYTTTPPSDMAIPVWIYLGLDPTTNREMAILYTTPSLYNQTGSGSGGSGGAGSTGPQGPQGPQGEAGKGFKIFATTSVQSTSGTTGNIGEFLLDTTVPGESKLYLYQDSNNGSTGYNNAYTFVSNLASSVNVVGEQGPTGEQGPAGVAGPQGPTGPTDGAMPWIQKNIIDSPPAATVDTNTITRTSTDIYIPWTYPEQIYLNLINSWAPVINTFNAEIYYKTNAGATSLTKQSIVVDGTGTAYINDHSTQNHITGIILTKSPTASTGLVTVTFPNEVTPRKAYRYYHADLANIVVGTSKLVMWYNKYTPTKVEIPLPVFSIPGKPSAPLVTNVTAIPANYTSLTVSYNPPTSVDISDANSSATITQYTITYSSPGSTERYGGPIADTQKSVTTANTTYTLTNLLPDSSYTVKVKATNSLGLTSDDSIYGLQVDPTPLTTVPNLSAISPVGSTPLISGSIYKVSDNTQITNDIIRLNTLTPSVQFTPVTIPIHSVQSRGSTGAALAALDVSLQRGSTEISQESVIFNGFGQTDPTDSNLIPMNIQSSTADVYAANPNNAYKGFYKSGTSTITLNSTGLFDNATNDLITLSVTQQQKATIVSSLANVGTAATYGFYYDMTSVNPTITSVNLTRVNTTPSPGTQQVSGLTIFTGSGNLTYDITTVVTNMGKHFYKSPLLEYTNPNTTNTITNTTETNTSRITAGITNGQFDNEVTFVRRYAIPIYANTYSNGLDVTVVANNVFGSSLPFTSPLQKIIFDSPSLNYINNGASYPRTVPNITISSGFVRGAHVASGTAQSSVSTNPYVPSFTYSDPIYDHTVSLTTNQELPIMNGSFRTFSTGYLNYSDYTENSGIDYSALPTVDGYRFATFKWKITESQTQINTVSFLLDGINTGSLQYSNTLYKTLFTGTQTPIILYYRFVDEAALNAPVNADYATTVWISGSSQGGTLVSSMNFYSPTDNSVSYSGLNSISSTSSSYTFNVLSPFRGVRTSYLYCRVGIPTNINFNFSHISARLYAQ